MRGQNKVLLSNKVTLKVQAFVTMFHKWMHTFGIAFWALGMELLWDRQSLALASLWHLWPPGYFIRGPKQEKCHTKMRYTLTERIQSRSITLEQPTEEADSKAYHPILYEGDNPQNLNFTEPEKKNRLSRNIPLHRKLITWAVKMMTIFLPNRGDMCGPVFVFSSSANWELLYGCMQTEKSDNYIL